MSESISNAVVSNKKKSIINIPYTHTHTHTHARARVRARMHTEK